MKIIEWQDNNYIMLPDDFNIEVHLVSSLHIENCEYVSQVSTADDSN